MNERATRLTRGTISSAPGNGESAFSAKVILDVDDDQDIGFANFNIGHGTFASSLGEAAVGLLGEAQQRLRYRDRVRRTGSRWCSGSGKLANSRAARALISGSVGAGPMRRPTFITG